MDQMEDKLGAILGNPDMMQKIMSMAQALGGSQEAPIPQAPPPRQEPSASEPDLASIQNMMRIMRQTAIDADQINLLNALRPYLPKERIAKLEKAMRAAKLANLAASVRL